MILRYIGLVSYVCLFLSTLAVAPPAAAKDLNALAEDGMTPLYRAVWNEQPLDEIQAFIDAGADPNVGDEIGRTPLHAAAFTLSPDAAQALLESGADPNASSASETTDVRWRDHWYPGYTPLHVAASQAARYNCDYGQRCLAAIQVLLDAGADPNAVDLRDRTPLHLAAQASGGFTTSGKPAAAQALLDAGADSNAADNTGWTPLHLAARGSGPAVVQALLDAGADPRATTHEGNFAVNLAERNGAVKDDPVLFRLDPVAHSASMGESPATAFDLNARAEDGTTLLFRAVWNEQPLDKIQAYIDAGADPNVGDEFGRTPLHAAAYTMSPAAAQALLESGADPDARSTLGQTGLQSAIDWYPGYTPLHVAASLAANHNCASGEKCLAGIQVLLDAGADPNAVDIRDRTPLHLVARVSGGLDGSGRPDAAQALLEAGADPNAADQSGWTPLHIAARDGSPAVVQALLDAGADPGAKNRQGRLAVDLAERNERVKDDPVFARLDPASHSAPTGASPATANDLNALAEDGMTPLFRAVWDKQFLDEIQTYIDAGADPNVGDAYNRTSLHAAAYAMSPDVAQTLLEAGADPNARSALDTTDAQFTIHWYPGYTPLHVAAGQAAHYNCVYGEQCLAGIQILLDAGADPNADDIRGRTPLHLAARVSGGQYTPGNPAATEVLLEAGADPNAADQMGWTPLHLAARDSGPAVVQALLDAGADPRVKNHEGNLAVDLAAGNGKVKDDPVFARLDPETHSAPAVASPAAALDLNARAEDGMTPLFRAVWNEQPLDEIQAYIDAGADPNIGDEFDRTPLHAAAYTMSPAAAQVLLESGADPNARSTLGLTGLQSAIYWYPEYTPLHVAASLAANHNCAYGEKCLAGIQVLLDAGADPNAVDIRERTPLHIAARVSGGLDGSGKPAASQALLDAGADPNAADQWGWTPLHVAARDSSPAVVQALLDAGADPGAKNHEGKFAVDLAEKNREVKDDPVFSRLDSATRSAPTAASPAAANDANARGEDGMTPLYRAVWNEQPVDGIQEYIDAGADPNVADEHGRTPLHAAAFKMSPAAAQALLESGADPNARSTLETTGFQVTMRWHPGYTPLHVAAAQAARHGCEYGENCLAGIQALLDGGADPNAADNDGWTPLHLAARASGGLYSFAKPDAAQVLLDGGADPNAADQWGWTPLHLAAKGSSPAMVRALLDAGADPGIQSHKGVLAVDLAAQNGRVNDDPVFLRLDPVLHSAPTAASPATSKDANALDKDGMTPLFRAVWNEQPVDGIQAYIDAGADPNAADEHGRTPLHAAAFTMYPAAAQALLESGADPNARSTLKTTGIQFTIHWRPGYTPLHVAAAQAAHYNCEHGENCLAGIQALLDAGADPNAADARDRTPLHLAARVSGGFYSYGKPDATQALLDAGADPNVADSVGWTPLHLAAHESSPAVVRALLDAGADPRLQTHKGTMAIDLAAKNGSVKGDPVFLRLDPVLFRQ